MKTFKLLIVSYDSIIFKGEALFCGVATPSGTIGFEARHEPFVAVLKENSEITYKEGKGAEGTVSVESGHITFKDNRCVITVIQSR